MAAVRGDLSAIRDDSLTGIAGRSGVARPANWSSTAGTAPRPRAGDRRGGHRGADRRPRKPSLPIWRLTPRPTRRPSTVRHAAGAWRPRTWLDEIESATPTSRPPTMEASIPTASRSSGSSSSCWHRRGYDQTGGRDRRRRAELHAGGGVAEGRQGGALGGRAAGQGRPARGARPDRFALARGCR